MKDVEAIHKRLNRSLEIIKRDAIRILHSSDVFPNAVFIVTMTKAEPIPFMFRDNRQKTIVVALILEMAKAVNAIGIIMASDAWVTTHKPDGKAVNVNEITPPSQSPERRETLIITATGPEFQKGFHIPYHRVDGKVVLEEEKLFNDFEDLNFSSLFRRKFDA